MEVFVSSCKDIPIRLWNITTGESFLYKSDIYRFSLCLGYNDMDEVLSMTSVRMSRNGAWIYGGSRK